jgi:peptidoglycan-associated lipoprotein
MKSAKLLNVLVLGVLLVSVAAGCQRGPKNVTAIPERDVRIRNDGLSNPLDSGRSLNPDRVDTTQINQLPEPMEGGVPDRETLAANTIYFDFDRSAIRPSEQSKLDAVATYLKNTPNVQLVVEGHCDERGTEEYNRSLGERRAISAREYLLQKHGLSSERVTTASFGEDKPVSNDKTEEGYARNRRGEFVLLRR